MKPEDMAKTILDAILDKADVGADRQDIGYSDDLVTIQLSDLQDAIEDATLDVIRETK